MKEEDRKDESVQFDFDPMSSFNYSKRRKVEKKNGYQEYKNYGRSDS